MTTNTTAPATTAAARLGHGKVAHRVEIVDGVPGRVWCGAQRVRGMNRQAITVLADQPVTCTRCGADEAPAEKPAPTAPAMTFCTNVVYGETCGSRILHDGTCGLCDF